MSEQGPLVELFLPLSVVLVMISIGLALVADDFTRLLRSPKPILIGLVAQLCILPVVGFAVASLFPLEPILAAGVVLIAVCPGGSFSNLIIHAADGDRALSVSLTALSGPITLITIPLLVNFDLEYFLDADETIQLPLVETLAQVALLTVIPIVIGMAIRHRWPDFALRFMGPSKTLSSVLMALVVIGLLLAESSAVRDSLLEVGPAVLTLNAAGLTIGYLLPALLGLNWQQNAAISVGTGIQNAPLAIAIALTIVGIEDLAIPAAVFGVTMLFTASGLVLVLRALAPSKASTT